MPPRNPTDILAAAAAIAGGTGAYAQAVRFDNVGLEFRWKDSFLDITNAAQEQEDYQAVSSARQLGEGHYICYYYDCSWWSQVRIVEGDLLLANKPHWYFGDPLIYGFYAGDPFDAETFDRSKSNPFLRVIACDHHGQCNSYDGVYDYGYIAARFELEDGVHFGWVLSRRGTYHSNSFDALAWGYERSPGTPILAGDGESPGLCAADGIYADDGAAGNGFGHSLAAGHGGLLVGAPRSEVEGENSGAAYFYSANFESGVRLPTPPGIGAGDLLGFSAACFGGEVPLLAVGAPRHDEPMSDSGAVYLFQWENSQWKNAGMLTAPDAGADDRFGWRLSAWGDTLAISAPYADVDGVTDAGAVYIFNQTEEGVAFTRKVVAPLPMTSERFGWSVGVSAEPPEGGFLSSRYVIIGSPFETTEAGAEAGAVYVGVGGMELRRFVSPSAKPGDRFGLSVSGSSLHEDLMLVGAPGANGGAPHSGAVYFLDDFWFPNVKKISPAKPIANGAFGSSVSIYGTWAAIGATNSDCTGAASGCVASYEYRDGEWIDRSLPQNPTGSAGDHFGHSAIVGAGFIAAGAPDADGPGGPDQGTVARFSACPGMPCYADLDHSTGLRNLDLFDFLAFVNFFNASDPRADCDKNGLFDLFDFLCFTNAFNEGCP
jgi:hypothetical protein